MIRFRSESVRGKLFFVSVGWLHVFYSFSFFSHNHGSGKWLYLKGNCYWRDPFFTSMIMGGKVLFFFFWGGVVIVVY